MILKKVIFFIYTPISGSSLYIKRLGGEVFRNNNIEVSIYDFSKLFKPEMYSQHIDDKKVFYYGYNHHLFETESDALLAINKLNKETTLVIDDGILGTKIFRTEFSKTGVQFGVQILTAFPFGIQSRPMIDKLLYYFKKEKIKTLKKVLIKLFKINSTDKYPTPNFCIASGKKSIKMYKKKYNITTNTKIVWAHNFDYDRYLMLNEVSSNVESNGIVYLDQGIGLNQDEKLMKKEGLAVPDLPYQKINLFFDNLEHATGYEIVIALHPRMPIEEAKIRFNKRKVIHNKTLEMINSCSLVLGHWSTSIQFAVIMKKPLILLTSDSFIEDGFHHNIDAYAKELCQDIHNIDCKVSNALIDNIFDYDDVAYDNYFKNYIKYSDCDNKLAWQIVIDQIRGLYHE
jgi:hypothetical protein